jgi:hypothetical protein
MVMLRAAGMFLTVMGIIWVLQGVGLLNWPANSFMLGQSEWAIYGALIAALGVTLVWLARLLGRSRR